MNDLHLKQERLRSALEELANRLGITLNKLWEVTGENKNSWNSRIDPGSGTPTQGKQISRLLSRLREAGYYVLPEQASKLYEAIGMAVPDGIDTVVLSSSSQYANLIPARPTGTITFLFTDIEASTLLWERQPQLMQKALAQHDVILRQIIEKEGGYIFKTVGDAFYIAFVTAPQALKAVLAMQRALQKEIWPLEENATIKVRMALHTGAVEERDGDYFGQPLNRIARLLSIGHGGQILLSAVTQELVRDHLPSNVSLKDLGEHRLKDLIRPERVFQLISPDLPDSFPALKSLASFPNNLPVQITTFIGREREITEVKRLLEKTHLLTLTGTGGAGKTRLSLEVGAELLESFEQGVWFVELSPLTDPGLVASSVASTLGIHEEPDRPILTTLLSFLRAKKLLLILDNCEHLIVTVAQFSHELLRACPGLRILASSRESMGIAGEVSYKVPSLTIPERYTTIPFEIESLSQYEAVRLFIDRALGIQPKFKVTNKNAPALAQICQQLDGIPLAIELAAARIKVLTLEQIAARLNDRFHLLTQGNRTALPRQQTLRAAVDWSYDLLSPSEQTLLCRISVFKGGCTLEAVEAVCSSAEIEVGTVLDLLSQLVNKSLVITTEDIDSGKETRYDLLETLREYCWEKLLNAGEAVLMQNKHSLYFVKLCEKLRVESNGPDLVVALERLDKEYGNVRASLSWVIEGQNKELSFRFAAALVLYWEIRGYFKEARNYLEKVLALPVPDFSRIKGEILNGLGRMLRPQGEYKLAEEYLRQGLVFYRELEDKAGVAYSLNLLGLIAENLKEYDKARLFLTECLQIRREIRSELGIVITLNNLAVVELGLEAYPEALQHLEEALTWSRDAGHKRGIAICLVNLSHVALKTGDLDLSHKYLRESLPLYLEMGDWLGIASSLACFANLAIARFLQLNNLKEKTETSDSYLIYSAKLCGIVSAWLKKEGSVLDKYEEEAYTNAFTKAQTALGKEVFSIAFLEGQSMQVEEAIRFALTIRSLN